MTRSRSIFLIWFVASILGVVLFLSGCGDSNSDQNFNYLRQASDFTVDTVPADTLCDANIGLFTDKAECVATKKFLLHWERPDDTTDFLGYRLYLDTNPGEISWKQIQEQEAKASVVITETSIRKGGLVFFLYDGKGSSNPRPDTLAAGSQTLFRFDSSGRREERTGSFVFALTTHYSGGKTRGQPQFTFLITDDKFPPNPISPFIQPGAHTLSMQWARPTDPVSIFNTALDTGIILEYRVSLRLVGRNLTERGSAFAPTVRYWVGGIERSGEVRDTVINQTSFVGRRFDLPDSNRAHHGPATLLDSIHFEVSNLTPRDTLEVTVLTLDSTGINRAETGDFTILLTDTTQPTTPRLAIPDSSITNNGFTITWSASTDSTRTRSDGSLEYVQAPNHGIREYRLSRILKSLPQDTAPRPERIDTVITIKEGVTDAFFRDTVDFLPPGATFKLRLVAVDYTGYISAADSAEVTTKSIRFTGRDSGFTCPPGLIPIPGSNFALGERAGADPNQGKDETPPSPEGRVAIRSFCIEPYEHRDSTGKFTVNATWQEADSVCRALSPADNSALCSEVEWERACEGFDTPPLVYGIQNGSDAAILQSSCNQATGDALMAFSFELRNKACLTKEGVYDMAGNLSEWVRDSYLPSAYQTIKTTDTLDHAFTFKAEASTADSVHGYRGGNFQKSPTASLPLQQSLARCSNRDYPEQTRPRFKQSCMDESKPLVALVYSQDTAGVKCLPLDSLRPPSGSPLDPPLDPGTITDIIPARDSTKLFVFTKGATNGITLAIPDDPAFRGRKPLEAKLTPLSLAKVVFVNAATADSVVDYLDAKEMQDMSQATLEKIFLRESPSDSWKVKMENGKYRVQKIYAMTFSGSKVAKPYYANRAIGFRCCSLPRPPPAR